MINPKILTLSTLALACGLLLTSCGGSGGGTTTTATGQTINGNVIPSRPDQAVNDSTVKGIDSNNNGVRDDVEILVASFSKASTYSGTTFRIAQIENKLATENIASQEEYSNLFKERFCLTQKLTQSEKEILTDSISYATKNTRERSALSFSNDKKYSSVFQTGVIECN